MATPVQRYYDHVARDYDQSFYVKKDAYPTLQWRHRHILDVIDLQQWPEGAKALDIGCGPGAMVADLAARGFEVWGIDISQEMIEIAKEKTSAAGLPAEKIHLSTGDIEALEFADESFDLIVCAGVIEYLHTDEKWSRELTRTLKPNGLLAINVTNPLALRRWTHPLIEGIKGWKPVYRLMDGFKRKVLRRGPLNRFPFKPRVHTPAAFDRHMAGLGFEKIAHRYFDFSVSVAPFDTLFGFINTPIKRWMERFSAKRMGWSAVGYITFGRKRK
jgi:ubiquinone/menaquinone biosynthesis C-methylase UbiE